MSRVRDVLKNAKKGDFKKALGEIIWIYKLAKKFIPQIILYSFLLILKMGISILLTVSIKEIVDSLVDREMKQLIMLASFYVCFGLVNIAVNVISQRIGKIVGYYVFRENTKEVFGKILGAEWESLSEYHSGDLLNRMFSNVNEISDSLTGWIPNLFIQLLQMMVATIIITIYDPSLIVVLVLVSPIVIFSSRIFVGKLYKYNQQAKVIDSELMILNKESFHNLQTVKAFGITGFFENKMNEMLDRITFVGLKVVKYSILSWATMYMSGQMAAIVCLGWTAYHVYSGVITLGTMLMIASMATYISESFKSMVSVFPKAISTVTSAERIRKIIDLPKEAMMNELKYEEMLRDSIHKPISIKLENVCFSYKNGKQVFDGIDFIAKSGETVALVGPSGEGKTTMLRILLGIVTIASGRAVVYQEGQEKELLIDPSIRKLISYVPQGNTLMSGTIAENLRMVNKDATDEEIISALKDACAYEFVNKLESGIDYETNESGNSFSEGQNQRLAIARALLCKSPILLLDEATSALDVVTERRVLKNIAKGHMNRLCILTTHRPTVLGICDRVYRIANTKISIIDEEQIVQLMNDF